MAEDAAKRRQMPLRQSRTKTVAKLLRDHRWDEVREASGPAQRRHHQVAAGESRQRREVIEGAATVDEWAIKGESAPVIREAGGDRSSVTGEPGAVGTLKIRIPPIRASSFLDRMIGRLKARTAKKHPMKSP